MKPGILLLATLVIANGAPAADQHLTLRLEDGLPVGCNALPVTIVVPVTAGKGGAGAAVAPHLSGRSRFLRRHIENPPQAWPARADAQVDGSIERLLGVAVGPVHHAAARPSAPRLGAVSFLHRFGSALNRHVHLHAWVTDGLCAQCLEGPGAEFLHATPVTPGFMRRPLARAVPRLVPSARRRRPRRGKNAAAALHRGAVRGA